MKHRFTTAMGASAAAVALCMGSSAQAVVVEVGTEIGNGADAMLFNDDGILGQFNADTTGGGSNSMDVRLLTDGTFTERFRAGIIRLDLSAVTQNLGDLVGAGLKFQNATQSREILIFGLNDGDADEAWDEAAITWNTAPGLTPNPNFDAVLTTAGQVDTGRWTELGYWTPMGPGSGGNTTEFSTSFLSTENPAGWTDDQAAFADEFGSVDVALNSSLTSFVQNDTDGLVSLLFMISERVGPANGGAVSPRTKEWVLNPANAAAALTTPTLVLDFADVLNLEGDLDNDGFVGIADLNLVLGAWNQNVASGDPLQGDPSGDGFVGIEDLNLVLGNWNAGTPPAAGAVIPEPAALSLLAVGGLGLLGRRRD